MKFVTFMQVNLASGETSPIKISPLFTVSAPVGMTGFRSDCVEIRQRGEIFTVLGTVEEVSAALESATAPPVAAAVEVAPTDLERAATIVDLLAEASEDEDGELWTCVGVRAVDAALGLGDCGFDDTSRALRALAAKLRGGG